jgi:lysophospholipase L1-like esterase
MTSKRFAFAGALACLLVAMIGIMLVAAEVGYRRLNDITIFPTAEFRPKDMFEQYAYSLFMRSDNNVLYYEPKPGGRYSQYLINEHGFRGPAVSIDKPPTTTRIVFLGDSIVWGHAVDVDKTLSAQLEARLNDASSEHNVEVLNFGVSGYSTQQEVELFVKRAMRFKPDFVIVGFCLNDFEKSSVEARPFERVTLPMTRKSYMLENFRRVVYHLARDNFDYNIEPDFVLKAIDVKREFQRLDELVDTRILLTVFPTLVKFDTYAYAHLHADALRSVEGLDYDTLDLLDTFRPYNPDQLKVSPTDVTHPNAFGISLATDQIAKYFMSLPEADRYF